MAAQPAVPNELELALTWIGFDAARALTEDLRDFDSMGQLSEKDITKLASGYASRTIAEGRIHFGLARTKRLQALLHWVQDFQRVGEEATTENVNQPCSCTDFQNLTNRENPFIRRYNRSSNEVNTVLQSGFFPDILWRIEF